MAGQGSDERVILGNSEPASVGIHACWPVGEHVLPGHVEEKFEEDLKNSSLRNRQLRCNVGGADGCNLY